MPNDPNDVRDDPSESLPTTGGAPEQAGESVEKVLGARTDRPAERGMPGSVEDSRRCTATANRTGERCRAPAIKGGKVCRVHGGAAGHVKKAAKDRLLELVDPALAALHAVLADKDTDDSVKVRAALGILDRTGFRPGVVVEVDPGDKWSQLLDEVTVIDNRQLGAADDQGQLTRQAALQLALDARTDAWREYNNEDQAAYEAGRIRPDENTVVGSFVVGPYDVPVDRGPTDPPRYEPTETPEAER